jgi:ankyrin repeat protein
MPDMSVALHLHDQLCTASVNHKYKLISTLVQQKADPNLKRRGGGDTPLQRALYSASVGLDETVQALLKCGADPRDGLPLHAAAAQKQLSCMKLLMKSNADPLQTNNCGLTAIDISNNNGDTEAVETMMYWRM